MRPAARQMDWRCLGCVAALWLVVGGHSAAAWGQLRPAPGSDTKVPHGSAKLPPTDSAETSQIVPFHKHIDVVYQQQDDYELHCDVFVPEGRGPFPAVLALHGGAWRFGSKWQLARQVRRLAQAGFVVVAANYRLAPEWKFPAQVQDGWAALRWMQTHADEYSIDVENIYGYGYSAGGHLISLIAVSRPEDWRGDGAAQDAGAPLPTFRAVAVGGAPCDFRWVDADAETLEYWLGGSPQEVPRVYAAVTALDKVSSASPPFFLFHAADDVVVPVACAQRMHAALNQHQIPNELLVLPDSSHLAAFNDAVALERTIEFFRSHLVKK